MNNGDMPAMPTQNREDAPMKRQFSEGETYYIGESLSLWAYRGTETNFSGTELHVFQCVEFDCDDEFEYYEVCGELQWIQPSSSGPAAA